VPVSVPKDFGLDLKVELEKLNNLYRIVFAVTLTVSQLSEIRIKTISTKLAKRAADFNTV